MKRYGFSDYYRGDGLDEYKDGAYVRFEDHITEVAALERRLQAFERTTSFLIAIGKLNQKDLKDGLAACADEIDSEQKASDE